MCQFVAFHPEKASLSRRTFTCPNGIRMFRYGFEVRPPLAFGICLDRK
jgi:hypothetical protein